MHGAGAKEKAGHFGLLPGVLGIEPSSPNLQPANPQTFTQPAESEKTKYGTKSTGETAVCPELQAVIDAWPKLPDRVRQRIIGLVEGATALERSDEA